MVAGLSALAALVTMTGCSSRSVEAYCQEMDDGYAKIQGNLDDAGDDPLAGLGSIFVNAGEFTSMLHKLQDVAPEEISGDLDDAVAVWDRQADAAGDAAKDPLGALAGQLTAAMMASASMRNVDTFSQKHCRKQLFGTAALSAPASGATAAAEETTPEPDPTPTVPAGALPAPDLQSFNTPVLAEAGGLMALEGNAEVDPGTGTRVGPAAQDGQSVVSVMTQAPLVKTVSAAVDSTCRWGLGPGRQGPVLVLEQVEHTDPAGLATGRNVDYVLAVDARTGQQLWRVKVGSGDEDDQARCTLPDGVTFTADGRYVVLGTGGGDDAWAVSTADGSSRKVVSFQQVAGPYLIASDPDKARNVVLDPGTGARLGVLPEQLLPGQEDTPFAVVGPAAGTRVLASNDEGATRRLEAFALPTGKRVWSVPSEAARVYGTSTSGVLVTDVDAVSLATGKRAWSHENFQPCLVLGETVIGVAETLVELDAETGEQLEYSAVTGCSPPSSMVTAGQVSVTDGYVQVSPLDVWAQMSSNG